VVLTQQAILQADARRLRLIAAGGGVLFALFTALLIAHAGPCR
jgi:hypothetical protein